MQHQQLLHGLITYFKFLVSTATINQTTNGQVLALYGGKNLVTVPQETTDLKDCKINGSQYNYVSSNNATLSTPLNQITIKINKTPGTITGIYFIQLWITFKCKQEGCNDCDDDYNCKPTGCETGFTFTTQDMLIPNQKFCKRNCPSGGYKLYSKDDIIYRCITCPQDCLLCSDLNQCDQCNTGKVFDETQNICLTGQIFTNEPLNLQISSINVPTLNQNLTQFKYNYTIFTIKKYSIPQQADLDLNSSNNQTCVQKKQQTWSQDGCYFIVENNQCYCKSPNPTTVTEDLKWLLINKNLQTALSSDGYNSLTNFKQCYKYAIVWSLVFITLLQFKLFSYGQNLDKKSNKPTISQIMQEPQQENPPDSGKIQTEQLQLQSIEELNGVIIQQKKNSNQDIISSRSRKNQDIKITQTNIKIEKKESEQIENLRLDNQIQIESQPIRKPKKKKKFIYQQPQLLELDQPEKQKEQKLPQSQDENPDQNKYISSNRFTVATLQDQSSRINLVNLDIKLTENKKFNKSTMSQIMPEPEPEQENPLDSGKNETPQLQLQSIQELNGVIMQQNKDSNQQIINSNKRKMENLNVIQTNIQIEKKESEQIEILRLDNQSQSESQPNQIPESLKNYVHQQPQLLELDQPEELKEQKQPQSQDENLNQNKYVNSNKFTVTTFQDQISASNLTISICVVQNTPYLLQHYLHL
ncbi:hypothetical protein ABPG74_019061 [Tetrahymena malaccensis]